MPYADPQSTHNPATGTIAPAAWGDAVRDALEYLARNRPHCRVYRTTNQSIANTTTTALTFDAERVDVGGMHSTSSNTGRITIPTGEGGFYIIGANVQFAINGTGYRQLSLRLNGSTLIGTKSILATTGIAATNLAIEVAYQFAAGDYIEVTVAQSSGGALNVETAANTSPEFWAVWQSV